MPLKGPADPSTRLAPGTREARPIADDIAAQVKLVAIARASQRLLKPHSGTVDLICRPASQPFARSIRKRAILPEPVHKPARPENGAGCARAGSAMTIHPTRAATAIPR